MTAKNPIVVFPAITVGYADAGFHSKGELCTAVASIVMARKHFHNAILFADEHWINYFTREKLIQLFTEVYDVTKIGAYKDSIVFNPIAAFIPEAQSADDPVTRTKSEPIELSVFWSTYIKGLALSFFKDRLPVAILDFDAVLWTSPVNRLLPFPAANHSVSDCDLVYAYREPLSWWAYSVSLIRYSAVLNFALESVGLLHPIKLRGADPKDSVVDRIRMRLGSSLDEGPINTSFLMFSDSEKGKDLVTRYIGLMDAFMREYTHQCVIGTFKTPIQFDGSSRAFGEILIAEQLSLAVLIAAIIDTVPGVIKASALVPFNDDTGSPFSTDDFVHLWKHKAKFSPLDEHPSALETIYTQWLLKRLSRLISNFELGQYQLSIATSVCPVTDKTLYSLSGC